MAWRLNLSSRHRPLLVAGKPTLVIGVGTVVLSYGVGMLAL